jgi:hypothetical protein
MKYLGIPVSDKHLCVGAFDPVVQKMIKRLDPWRGKFLTSGGRQILTNSCLSSIPFIVWVFTGFRIVFTRKWTVLEPSSFGKGLRRNLDTIWQSRRWCLDPKTKEV